MRLDGGNWVGSQPNSTDWGQVYYVKGDRTLSISVKLSDGRRFDFDNVAHAYASKTGSEVTTVDIDSFGYSKTEATQRLDEMFKKWQAAGVRDIDLSREPILLTDSTSHIVPIHNPIGPEDPLIYANIRFLGNEYYVMVTFFWNTPLTKR